MDTQFRNVEQASRLKVSLDLDNGDHFDQVIAISQGMINHAIKRIHEQNEDMNDFYGDSDSGSISADLAPSELVIPVEDPAAQKNNMVIWRTNVKQGTLTVNYRDVPPKDYTIDNWTIDVKVPLTWEKFEDAPDDDDAKRNRKRKQRDFIHNNFEVPGDYRPERLYAKMASGWWGEGVNFAGPSSIADKSSDEYKTWKEVKENDHASSTLESIFKGISLKREEDGMTTIGTRFNLDAAKITEHAATFAPTSMIHQSFPYRIGPESGKTGWETGIRGTEDPGSRNCLLYCENVNNRQITWRQLPQAGNFTTIGNPNSLGSRVDGSFVLSHQLIFEKFLLPKLQVFVKESQIYPGPANIELDGQHTYGLEIGVNPSKDPYRDPNNPIYRFHAVPANGYVDAHYEAYVESTYEPNLFDVEDSDAMAKWRAARDKWRLEERLRDERDQMKRRAQTAIDEAFDRAEGLLDREIKIFSFDKHVVVGASEAIDRAAADKHVVSMETYDAMPEEPPLDHGKYWGEGSPRVTVKWQKGGNRITVSGETNYNVYITIANNKNVNASHQLENARWREIVRWVLTWELHIDVTVKDGSLDLSITHDSDSFVKVVVNSKAADSEHHGTQSSLAKNLQQELEHLERALSRGFADTSKFFYPGNGQLTFKNAMFSEKGDLIAEIAYQDTPDQKKIIIPPPKKPDDPGSGKKDKPTSRLEWTAITPVKSSVSPVEIKITGKNTTNSTVYLSKIEVKYTGFKLGSDLFTSIDFVTTNGGADKVEISVEAESASTMLTPVLAPHKLTSKKVECITTYEAATSPIAVQPGGSIRLIAKGATGKPGVKKDLGIKEFWCDQAGKVPEGDGYYMAFVAVELS